MAITEIEKIGGPLALYEPRLLVEQRATIFYQLRKDLLWLHYKDGVTLEVEDVNALMHFNHSYPHEHKLIATIGKVINITKEAREMDEIIQPRILKKAIITKLLPQRIIINHMLGRRTSQHPTKVFSNIQAGLDWLDKE